MVNNDLIEFRSDELIMESLHEIAMDLPPIERSKYSNIVTEAIVTSPDAQAKIISKLSKQVANLQQIDLDQCNKSAGNITKYQYYNVMLNAIEVINSSENTADIQNVIRMNKIHTILLENADDFMWAYKHDETLIKRAYITLTRMLFVTIDLSISDYIKKLELTFKYNSRLSPLPMRINRYLKDVDNMIQLFENGSWRTLMTSVKKNTINQTVKALDEMKGVEPPAAIAKEAAEPVTTVAKFLSTASMPVKVVITVFVILFCYRKFAFYVAKAGGAFANVIRHCADLIKANDACNRNQSDSAVEKHTKLYNMMIGTADRIEAFFNKTSAAADKDIAEANRKEFNTSEITQINGMDFDLV